MFYAYLLLLPRVREIGDFELIGDLPRRDVRGRVSDYVQKEFPRQKINL